MCGCVWVCYVMIVVVVVVVMVMVAMVVGWDGDYGMRDARVGSEGGITRWYGWCMGWERRRRRRRRRRREGDTEGTWRITLRRKRRREDVFEGGRGRGRDVCPSSSLCVMKWPVRFIP